MNSYVCIQGSQGHAHLRTLENFAFGWHVDVLSRTIVRDINFLIKTSYSTKALACPVCILLLRSSSSNLSRNEF